MSEPLYSIGIWDPDLLAYTPREGLTVPSQNVNWRGLLNVKWVRPDKIDGKYLPEVSGQAPIWHWRPA